MDYKINSTHKVAAQEFSVDWNGYTFLIIYGQHKNGWFIAIPNWNVCVESAEPENDSHNTTVLARAHFHDEAPAYLAKAIREHFESIKNNM